MQPDLLVPVERKLETLTPRPFQVSTRERLRDGRAAGHRCQMVCSPTGSGKTILAMYLIDECLKRGRRAIFVADRITLIEQTSATASRLGLVEHGVIQGHHHKEDFSLPFQIGSAQTLARRKWPPADLIIIDEAHTQLKSWTDHIEKVDATVIGLSATPFSKGLGKRFSNLINAVTMAELVAQGTLVKMRVFAAVRADMRGAERNSFGEWTDAAAEQRGMKIVGNVVEEWFRHAFGRKTIVFGSTIKHCEEICRHFNAAGVMARVFCANTPDAERFAILNEFRRHDSVVRVLISVEALAKGFDVPDVTCIVDCRPLDKGFGTWVQMSGRGARSSPETGKEDFLLLDHSGNAERFAEDFEQLFYHGLDSLDDGEKLDKKTRQEIDPDQPASCCPSCGYSPFAKRCMSCGFTRQTSPDIQHAKGHLEEITLGGKKLAENRRDLFNQLLSYARMHSVGIDKQLWRAKYLYRDIVGAFPPADWTFDNTPMVTPTAETVGKIRSLNIRRAKGAQKGLLNAV